jgi:hypothetical protein
MLAFDTPSAAAGKNLALDALLNARERLNTGLYLKRGLPPVWNYDVRPGTEVLQQLTKQWLPCGLSAIPEDRSRYHDHQSSDDERGHGGVDRRMKEEKRAGCGAKRDKHTEQSAVLFDR